MKGRTLILENREEFTASLEAVSLAEHLVSHLIGGGSTRSFAVGPLSEQVEVVTVKKEEGQREELLEERVRKEAGHQNHHSPVWCIHRGATSYGVDVSNLMPCQSPLMRSRSLFEVAKSIKEGSSHGCLPEGTWDIDGVPAEDALVVGVQTGIGEVRVAVERVVNKEGYIYNPTGTTGRVSVSLPIVVSLDHLRGEKQFAPVPPLLQGPLSIITQGPIPVRVLQELYFLSHDIQTGEITMQRVLQESADIMEVKSADPEVISDATLPVCISLGEIQLTLTQLAKLRTGHTLRLREENLSLEGGFSCALTLGSTQIASGKLCFSGDRVVLTIAEVV